MTMFSDAYLQKKANRNSSRPPPTSVFKTTRVSALIFFGEIGEEEEGKEKKDSSTKISVIINKPIWSNYGEGSVLSRKDLSMARHEIEPDS